MNHWTRLALPLGLGLLAAVLNWTAVRMQIEPRAFVRVCRNLAVGEVITANDLSVVQLAGDLGALPDTAIPWEERSILYQWRTSRDLKRGDVVLRRDICPPKAEFDLRPGERAVPIMLSSAIYVPDFLNVGDDVSFAVETDEGKVESLGPFRILAIGKQLLREEVESDREHNRYQHILTLPAQFSPETGQPDEIASRLIKACGGGRGRERVLSVIPQGQRKREKS
jgi:hypothetical protein